jgi:hypothetical protein
VNRNEQWLNWAHITKSVTAHSTIDKDDAHQVSLGQQVNMGHGGQVGTVSDPGQKKGETEMKTYKHENVTLSKYTIFETPKGFIVTAPDRPTISVELNKHEFIVSNTEGVLGRISLYYFRTLVWAIAACLLMYWQSRFELETSPDEISPDGTRLDGTSHCRWNARDWAIGRIGSVISSRVYKQWQRLLLMVDPTVREMHRRMFSVGFSTQLTQLRGDLEDKPVSQLSVENWDELYQHRYLVQDILSHRAAAVAASRWYTFDVFRPLVWNEVGIGYSVDRIAVLGGLDEWTGLYSPSGRPYRSLNKSLMNLSGGVPPGLMHYLNSIELERPVTDRLELTVLLASIGTTHGLLPHNSRVYQHARRPQILEAMNRISEHLREPINSRKTRSIRRFCHMLNDYPEVHRGGIVGLADKSIRWHREQARAGYSELLDRYASSSEAEVLSPIDLTDYPDVRFLNSAQAIVEEAILMRHCIASYIPEAMREDCYLFHVEYKGEDASAMIDRNGRVVQAYGPRNASNSAAEYAGRVLPQLWKQSQIGTQNPGTPPNL